MDAPRYWFPVRPASRGWGWGAPQVWEGWAALAVFLALLGGGEVLLACHGQGELAETVYGCVTGALLVAVAAWKGEPQRCRHDATGD